MKIRLMELGRSMVEMLGVLAVIGVLSVIGIAGYKKAMLKIQVNDTLDAINKFKNEVEMKKLINPCSGSWYKMSNDQAACSLDRPDFLPNFAKGSYNNFTLYLSASLTTIEVHNIRINGFCNALLMGQGVIVSATETYMRAPADKNIYKDGLEYRCYRASTDIEW